MFCAARYITDYYRFYFVTLTFSFSDENPSFIFGNLNESLY